MDKAERAGDERIGQLKVELLNLRGQHQALVDDGAAGERGNEEELLAFDVGGGHFVFGAAANAVKQALEGVVVSFHALGLAEEELLNIRLRGARFAADGDRR